MEVAMDIIIFLLLVGLVVLLLQSSSSPRPEIMYVPVPVERQQSIGCLPMLVVLLLVILALTLLAGESGAQTYPR